MATVLSPMVSHKTHVIQGYLHYIIITTQSISLFYTDGRPKKIHQDLSYDDSLSGRPGAWLVKKIFFICMQSQNLKKTHIEIQNYF